MTLRKWYTWCWKLDRTLWRTDFGRGYRPVLRQTTEWMNEWMNEWMEYTLKPKVNLKNTQKINSFLRENIFGLYYKNQPVNVVSDNNRNILWKSYDINKYTTRTKYSVFTVKWGGTYSDQCRPCFILYV
jgi:hypothetical protein